MADRSWGSGWPNCQRSAVVTVVCGRNGLRLPVRREIAALVAALVRDLENARGSGFRPDWSWGFACRAIRGTTRPSNHSWGLAIDLDAPTNPMQSGVRPPGRNTMPANAAAIAARYGFRWGGTYTSRPDPMHFEFVGTLADAKARAAKLPGPSAPAAPASRPTLRIGSRGPAVRELQQRIGGLTADGIFGPKTGTAVRAFQRREGLKVDGIVGPATWRRLLK
jgi:hypothetical protein